jgi:hypothetical protein
MLSPYSSLNLVAPSKLTHAAARLSKDFFSVIFVCGGKINGLKERLWGASGVRQIQSVLGCTRLPPADMLYAVDPVGVEMMMPSPIMLVILQSFMYNSS